jgi:NAD(P)-dependent dehydrogenase (short-subunit alcohol dehydrogenase family)
MTPGAALVTGAARRIGRAMALDLAAQGWSVAVHYHRSAAEAEAVAAAARAMGVRSAALGADLLDHAAIEGLVARAAIALDRPLTLLVNNASIFERDTLAGATRTTWDRHMDSNLWAPFRLTQDFAAQAPEAGRDDEGLPIATGCVVNMIDQRVLKPTPEFMTYTLAKMGLWAFTRTAAQALAPRIRVNAIGPGPTVRGARQSPEHFARQRAATLLGRGAGIADLAAGLRYILSAPAMTGQLLTLDGGQHLAWRTPDVIGVE